ncbi:LuxR C-terminal-related transcriptional regulator [Nonomuraea sp. NPDC000554]|uniref:LuxR C-terminal-related transcriptional regulator n=1 Tax=Nonomuraea sp. NPDC000554 TaxID=3154259 RepID=UPI00332DC1B3
MTGPPGSGKTVTVNAWAVTETRPCVPIVWMSGDRTPSTSDGLCAGLAECLPRAGVETGTAEPRPADLASLLSALDTPVVLVLDDFRPEPAAALGDFVTYLLKHAGPGLRIVITGRSDPPIPLRRYALAGQLTEVRAGDLAFSEHEIAAVLAQHGVRLGSASLRALSERTEGWAAGVRLAAMSMESHPDPDAFVEQFAGDDHAVVGYLVEEVLDAQPAGVRRLLLSTSVADRVNAELAAELAGDEAGRHFTALVRQNAFVVPLGHGWYRYHTMIREAFRLVLRHESPAEASELNRRAAAWFARAGHLVEAVRQAAGGGDWRYASRLVVDRLAIGRVLGLRPADPLADLFRDLPSDLVFGTREPDPAIVAAAASLARGDDRAAATALQHAERVLEHTPGEQAHARLCVALVRLARRRSADCAGNGDRAVPALLLGFPERLLHDRPELHALLLSSRAAATLRDGRLREAARLFDAALAAATEAGGDFQRRSCLGHLALVEALLGRFAPAAELTGRAAQLPEVSTSPAGRRVAAAHLADAWVRLERYELKAARGELDRAAQALRECPDTLMSMAYQLVGARVEIARGRPGRALELLDMTGAAVPRVPWLERRLRLVVAEAHLARGAADAARIAAERAGGAGTPGSAVALARAELCRGRTATAAGMVRHALAESVDAPVDVRVEAWLFNAFLSYSGAEESTSNGRRSLGRALRLAEREQIRLPFALSGEWLRAVLRHDPELARPYHRLLDPLHLGDGPAGADRTETAAAVERLSSRELDVLRLLARTMSTEEIADDLCLSVNTIKTHLRSIYQKLGVTRRSEAVRRARHLSLLGD